jgi:hypothetical protein
MYTLSFNTSSFKTQLGRFTLYSVHKISPKYYVEKTFVVMTRIWDGFVGENRTYEMLSKGGANNSNCSISCKVTSQSSNPSKFPRTRGAVNGTEKEKCSGNLLY